MTGMETAIRAALEKAGIPGAQTRQRIYDSARGALDRSLARQSITDPERIADHRQRLETLIASIEAEWTPPSEAPAPTSAPPVETAAAAPRVASAAETPATGEPAWPAADRQGAASGDAAPMVEPPSRPSASASSSASLDIAPDVRDHAAAAGQTENHTGSAAESLPEAAVTPAKPAKKIRAAKPPKQKRRRGLFASLLSAAVMLSFFGIGAWWLIESGALKSAAERDTGVPNPPPSLSRDDYAGGPQPLNPGAGFSGEWANVYAPGGDGAPQTRGNASVDLVDGEGGPALRIFSQSGGPEGEVLVPLGAEVLQALAGRQSMLAITVRSASPETTQIYVKCEFSVLGDCGRRRFDVESNVSDLLISLDYDRALAPSEGGHLVINSDISGAGKGIDLIALRIRPLN